MNRRFFAFVLQALISAGVLYFVSRTVDWAEMAELVNGIDLYPMILAFVTILSIRFAVAFRWRISLTSIGIDVAFSRLVLSLFVSHSIGYLTPGGLGSDVLRTMHIYSTEKQLLKIASTLLLERIMGVISLTLVLACAYLIIGRVSLLPIPYVDWVAVLVLSVFFAVALALMLDKFSLTKRIANIIRSRLPSVANKIDPKLQQLTGLRRSSVKVLFVSVAVQLIRCLAFYLIFLAVNVHVPTAVLLFVIPIVFLAMLLPISIGGIGVREGVLLVYSDILGAAAEQAILAGLAFYALQLAALIPGFIISLVYGVKLKSRA